MPQPLDRGSEKAGTEPDTEKTTAVNVRFAGRSARDLARALIALAVVAIAFLAATVRPVDPLEIAIFREFALLPGWTVPISKVLVLGGSPLAIAVVSGIAFYLHRMRLGLSVIVAGTGAWAAAHYSRLVISPRSASVTLPSGHETLSAAFPSDHMAIAVAICAIVVPYAPRAFRKAIIPILVLIAVALDYTGHELPLNLFAGAFLGWAIAGLTQVAFGAPGRSVASHLVKAAIDEAGLGPCEVEQMPTSLFSPNLYRATSNSKRLIVEVVRRGQRRAGWTYKARRALAELDVQNEPSLSSPRHEVDHEALIMVLAARSGVRAPAVSMVAEVGSAAMLVREEVPGRPLSHLAAQDCDDALLDDIWLQVKALSRASIAHHDLRSDNVIVDDEGRCWLEDFTFATTGATRAQLSQDVAEMLVTQASVVGVTRAVTSASRILEHDELKASLRYLQPLALPARIRHQLGGERSVLMDLADEVASHVGEPRPPFRPKISPRTAISLAVAGGAVYILLPQFGTLPHLLDAFKGADYRWLVVAFVFGALTFPMAAISYRGSVSRHLPFGWTSLVQVASAFTSRLTPGGLGGMGLNVRYIEQNGVGRPEAVGAVALNQAAGVVVHATLFFLALAVLGTSSIVRKVSLPTGWPVLIGVVVAFAAAGLAFGSRFGRHRVVAPVGRVAKKLLSTLRHPLKAMELFGGSAGVTFANAAALVASLAAFDSNVHVWSVAAVYITGAAIASAAPTPGNLGAVEAALAAGLTGIGVHSEAAVATVLSFRLLTFWLPIVPGVAALRYLQHRRSL